MTPWEDNPYALVSLYDMNKFAVERFIAITDKLTFIVHYVNQHPQKHGKVDISAQKSVEEHLTKIEKECGELSLVLTIDQIKRINRCLPDTTFVQLANQIHELQGRLYDETHHTLFMYVPKDKERFYSNPLILFGEDLAAKFSIIYDVEEACKCYATGRDTACVFHLMRIMEAGLRYLCHEAATFAISIPDPDSNRSWVSWLRPIEKELGKDRKDKSAEWNATETAYAAVATQLRTVSTAWRNPTMHMGTKYTSEEALDIFNAVKAFMRQLSSMKLCA